MESMLFSNMKSIFSDKYKVFVVRIREARVKAGITQGELAKRIGKTQSYISKLESAQIRLDIVQLKELAQAIGKNIKHFLD